MLKHKCAVTSEFLCSAGIRNPDIDAVVVAADIRSVENISALKAVSARLTRIPKRVFLIDRQGSAVRRPGLCAGSDTRIGQLRQPGPIAGKTVRWRRSGNCFRPNRIRRARGGFRRSCQHRLNVRGRCERRANRRQKRKKCRQQDSREHRRKWPVRLADDGAASSRRHLSALSAGDRDSRRFRTEPRHVEGRRRAAAFGRHVSRHRQGEDSARRPGQARAARRSANAP